MLTLIAHVWLIPTVLALALLVVVLVVQSRRSGSVPVGA